MECGVARTGGILEVFWRELKVRKSWQWAQGWGRMSRQGEGAGSVRDGIS